MSKTGGKVIDVESGLMEYSDDSMNRISKIIVTVLSSILPVLTTVVLWVVHSTIHRIGIMIVFTSLFAAALAAFTSARRIEIFVATASYV